MPNNTTLTVQKKELGLDGSKHSWLWQYNDFRKMKVFDDEYKRMIIFVNKATGLSDCWDLQFLFNGYNTELQVIFWRHQTAETDNLKPIIQISILNHEMKKVKTVSCQKYKKTVVGSCGFKDEYCTPRIELETILDSAVNILSVLIEFDVSIVDTRTLTQVSSVVIPDGGKDGLLGSLQDSLSKYIDNNTFSDVVLEVKGVEFNAHKLMLAAQSQVFATMFKQTEMTEAKENRVKIDDIEPDVAKQMLDFIYTDEAPSKIGDFPEQLLAAAHKYQMERLISKCEGILIEKISFDNAINTLIVADMYELEILLKEVWKFIKRNISLLKTTEFQDLVRDHLKLASEMYRMIPAEEEEKN